MSQSVSISTRSTTALPALAAGALAVGLLALRYAISPPGEDALREFVVVCALIGITVAIVFGRFVVRTAAERSPRTAMTLSLIGLLLAGVYWTGVSPVLAVAGIVLGTRSAEVRPGLARGAVVVGVLAIAANLAMILLDGTA